MKVKLNIIRKIICVVFFWGIIGLPLMLQGIFSLTGRAFDLTLNGYFDKYEKPDLTLNAFISGDYQKRFEAWLNNNILSRGAYIKLYNQIRYSCFDMGNNIIGKEKNLFEMYDIANELSLNDRVDYSLSENQKKMEKYVDCLERIDTKLRAIDKHLLVYTTPSKAEYEYDSIPLKYKLQARSNGKRGIDIFREEINKTEVNYLDTREVIINNINTPVFYSTGIHWSRPAEQISSVAVMDILSEISGKNLRNIDLGMLNSNANPYWRDDDLFELLNIFSSPTEKKYYEYSVSREYPEKYEKTKLLLQGGSFAQGLQKDYFDFYSNEELYYINYNNYIMNPDGEIKQLGEWSELDLGSYLDLVDFVVIEVNDAAIHNESNGFVVYLNEYLDEYLTKNVNYNIDMEEYSRNISVKESADIIKSKGVWAFEPDGFAWASDSMSVTIQNANIAEKGLEIELGIPEQILVNGTNELIIYINQKKVASTVVDKTENIILNLSAKEFALNPEDLYEIEIFSQHYFNPYEMGESGDNRDLALRIYYIGEIR